VKKIIWFIVAVLLLTGCAVAQGTSGTIVQADRFVPPASEGVNVTMQSGVVIKLEPASTTLNVGETVKVSIVVENVTNMNGIDVQVKFNPAVLQAQDGNSGSDGIQLEAVTSFLPPDFPVKNEIDNGAGLAHYAVVLLTSSPANGTGTVASITFEAIADGASELTFINSDLVSADNAQAIPVTPVNGQVTVGSGGGTTPVDTPVPTPTPTLGSGTMPTDTPMPTPTSWPGTIPTDTPMPPQPATPTPVVVVTLPPVVLPTPIPTFVPPPPSANLPQGATVGFCYQVQPGETLYGIGQDFGIDLNDIALVNDLRPPYHILAYQALFIPQELGRGPNFYIARAGDTLGSIAEQCHLSIRFLAQVNQLEFDGGLPLSGGYVVRVPIPPFPPVNPSPLLNRRSSSCCSSPCSSQVNPCR
jgi:hypothetical protein